MSEAHAADHKKPSARIGSTAIDDENNTSRDIAVGSQIEAVDYDGYFRSWNLQTFWRSVLFQMILFGA